MYRHPYERSQMRCDPGMLRHIVQYPLCMYARLANENAGVHATGKGQTWMAFDGATRNKFLYILFHLESTEP